ncbi:MAG: V-type ATP synthase subunit E family protein [Candidatus Anstonellaceae archaeon]
MSLKSLINQIERESQKKVSSIIENAKQENHQILEEAKKQAKKILQQASLQAEEFSKNYLEEKLAAAKTEEQRILIQAREEAVEKALADLWQEFSKFSSSSTYPKYLKKLVSMALEEIDSKSVVALCNAKDKKLLQSFGLKVEKTVDCAGGVIVQTKDGKVMVDYTFESIFEQKKPLLKTQIASILAEKEATLFSKQSKEKAKKQQKIK